LPSALSSGQCSRNKMNALRKSAIFATERDAHNELNTLFA
jgi:hypothetical protein